MMDLLINGERFIVERLSGSEPTNDLTVSELLTCIGITPQSAEVRLEGRPVAQNRFVSTPLHAGQALEILPSTRIS
jgi:sulfur carrier protein ThiS